MAGRTTSLVAWSSAVYPALNCIPCSSFIDTHIGQYRHPANRTPVPWLRFHRLPAEWPFVTPYRTWRPLGMSQSNPSADLALQPLLRPKTTVASAQSSRSGAIVTRGTVPAEWPFCWQERRGGPQHRTWSPLGLPQSNPGRVHPFRNQGGRVATAASVHPPTALPAAAHVTVTHDTDGTNL